MATEENDFIDRYLPLLLRGEHLKKHGTILVSNVRLQLHPSCRRLEYWKPPNLLRNQGQEVKGIDVGSLRGVFDQQGHGTRFRVAGLDQGQDKIMQLECLDSRTKRDWYAALKSLYKLRSVVSSPDFSRIAQQNATPNVSTRFDKFDERRQQQETAPVAQISKEQIERRTKWQERREARAERMDRISKKYAKR